MYLNKKQEKALQLALEAMENYEFSSYDEECNEAINVIVDMLHNSEKEKRQREAKSSFKKHQKEFQKNFLNSVQDSIQENFMNYQQIAIQNFLMKNT